MPITVERDDNRRRIIARGSGPLRLDDLMTFLGDHRTGVAATFGLFMDLRAVTSLPSGDELRAFAELLARLSKSSPRGRAAALATNDVVFASVRQLELWCETMDVTTVRACRTIEDAEAWLATN
jgi:hypothetical protein